MGDVIQFLYGEDGMDGAAVEGQRLEHLKMKEHQFREAFQIDLSSAAITPSWLKADDAELLRSNVDAHKLLEGEYQVRRHLYSYYAVVHCITIHDGCHMVTEWCVLLQQLREDLMTLRREVLPSGESSINLPVNLRRLIWNAQERFQCNRSREGPTGGFSMPPSAASRNAHWNGADCDKACCRPESSEGHQ